METICAAVREITDLTLEAFLNDNEKATATIEPLEEIVDVLKNTLRTRHIKRLQQGQCSIELGFVWSDLLNNLERVSDHCSNIAVCLMEMNRSEMNPHEALRVFRSDSVDFKNNLKIFQEKYALD